MRTNIVIDPALMAAAMAAGPYKTKKEAVEEGLKLLARQAAYREILKWEGKLKWEGDEDIDWTAPRTGNVTNEVGELAVHEPATPYGASGQAADPGATQSPKARRGRR
jgi:antitoxin ParD1/3/4